MRHSDDRTDRERITSAFKALRGLVFNGHKIRATVSVKSCSSGCCPETPDLETGQGLVFVTAAKWRQAWKGDRWEGSIPHLTRSLFINFGVEDGHDDDEDDPRTDEQREAGYAKDTELARFVIGTFAAQSLAVRWDGTYGDCIEILPYEDKEHTIKSLRNQMATLRTERWDAAEATRRERIRAQDAEKEVARLQDMVRPAFATFAGRA